jgi:hypothetical protein
MALLGIFAVSLVSADEIPENSHPMDRCAKFVNLNEFQDVVLIGFITGHQAHPYEAYQVENGVCLHKGYKLNAFSVYWTTKEKFSQLDLNNLKVQAEHPRDAVLAKMGYVYVPFPTELTYLTEEIRPAGGYVDNSNPLIKETIEYSITESPTGGLMAYMSKRTSEYNNVWPDKVETFEKPNTTNSTSTTTKEATTTTTTTYPTTTTTAPTTTTTALTTTTTEPTPEPQSFWTQILCFFKGLFGGSC